MIVYVVDDVFLAINMKMYKHAQQQTEELIVATHVPIIIIVQYILTNTHREREREKKLLLNASFAFSIDNSERENVHWMRRFFQDSLLVLMIAVDASL